jgi:hypothetical protein
MAGLEPIPYAGNTDNISQLMLTPTNVKDGIRAGAFQGSGYLGRGGGIYLGDVYPYSFNPNYSTSSLLIGTIPGNATVYLPLGTIPFASFTGFVTLKNGEGLSTGKCVELDFERTLDFETDQDCDVTVSGLDRYYRKMVYKKAFSSSVSSRLGPQKFVNSIKVTNKSSSTLNYVLTLGLAFGIPYNIIYDAKSFTKMILYMGNPLITCSNPPSACEWMPIITNSPPLYIGDKDNIPTITTGFTRPYFEFGPVFGDTSYYENDPFNGTNVVTIFTQHYGFGNLPTFASDLEQRNYLNNNDSTVLGLTPYSENFQTWVN